VHYLLSFQTPNSKLLGSTSGIITLAIVVSILLVLLLAPVFWAAARPDVRRPGEPRPEWLPLAARRRASIKSREGQGYWPAERAEDRHTPGGGHHAGRLGSWLVVGVVVVAFIVGGLALIAHAWWLFWACVAVVVLGAPAGKAVGIMNDTVEWGSSKAAQGADPEPGSEAVPVRGETERRP